MGLYLMDQNFEPRVLHLQLHYIHIVQLALPLPGLLSPPSSLPSGKWVLIIMQVGKGRNHPGEENLRFQVRA